MTIIAEFLVHLGLSAYKGAKGLVQFPKDKPMPLDLISKIVKFRVEENLEKAKAKEK